MSLYDDDFDAMQSHLGNLGDPGAVEASFLEVATIAIGAGGSGYSVNDVLSLATPTDGTPATARVTGVTAGVVTGVLLLTAGTGYSTGVKATTVSPAGGSGCTINVLTLVDGFNVILHNEYEPVTLFEGQIESRNPYIEIKDSDIVGVVHDTILWIDSVAYKVKEIKPDGTGITVLILSKD